jgi:hypothetical protein
VLTPVEPPPQTQVSTAVSTATASGPEGLSPAAANLPIHFTTDEEVKNAAIALFGSEALNTSRSLADVADVEGSGMTLALPFAQVKKGNWSVHKSCPDSIKEFMPVGGAGMPFYAVYIAHRVGVTLWQGDPTDGNPPVGAYVVPSVRTTKPPELAETILRETMKVGMKIQYTKGNLRDQYFPEGKLTPETHVLVWTPDTGYIVLVAPGYNATQDTLENFKGDIELKYPLWPLCFSLKAHETINKNAKPGDKNYKWEHCSIDAKLVTGKPDGTHKVDKLAAAWTAYRAENMRDIMNKAQVFLSGEDHSGMSIDEIVDLLAKYAQRIAALPARNRR